MGATPRASRGALGGKARTADARPRAAVPRTAVRVAVLGLAGLACCLALAGCAQFNKALGQQRADIYFKESTPVAFKLKVRAACDNLPHVKAAPIPKGVPLRSAIDIVVYDTTGASNADIARLEECVNKYAPQVQGVNFTDASDYS